MNVVAAAEQASEQEQVEQWRLRELAAAGYPADIASQIARRVDIDLHRAVGMLTDGCDPQLAAQILL